MGGLSTVRDLLSASGLSTAALYLIVGVFLIAAGYKLLHPVPIAVALVNFGVVRRVIPRLGYCIGFLELGLAVGLLSGKMRPMFALVSAGTLIGYTALLGRAVRSGDSFACSCFSASSEPIDNMTVTRTALLAVGALAVLAPRPADTGIHAEIYALVMAAAIAGIWQAFRSIVLLRQRWNFIDTATDWDAVIDLHHLGLA